MLALVSKHPSRPAPWLFPLLVGLVLSIPTLTVGLTFDDLIHRLSLEGQLEVLPASWFTLYDFTGRGLTPRQLADLGAVPWFVQADLSLRFFRPLSSLTLALDHAAFGRWSLPAHLHSLVWLAVLLGFVSSLYGRLLRPPTARLAGILYAVAGVHAIPSAWLASRHTLVAATFSVIALWAWSRFREDAWRPGAALAGSALALSLLSSEAWLAGVVFLVFYEWGRDADWRARLLGSSAFLGAGALYVAVYAGAGYGIRGSGMYVSPLSAPGEYLRVALTRMPLAFAELFGGLPSMLGGVAPVVVPVLAGSGVALLLLLVGVLFALRRRLDADERRALAWLGAAATVSPFVLIGTAVTGRVLPVPLIGAAALTARALTLSWQALREDATRRRWLLAPVVLLLGALHLGVSPLVRVGLPLVFAEAGRELRRVARTADVGSCADGGRIYLLTAADPALSLFLGPAVKFYTPEKAHAERLRILTVVVHDLELTRVGERAFELEVLGQPRRTHDFEQLYRARSAPLEPGQTFTAEELSVRILDASNGLYTRARFELQASLDAPSVCFVAWHDHRVQPIKMPAVGQRIVVPREEGPTRQ